MQNIFFRELNRKCAYIKKVGVWACGRVSVWACERVGIWLPDSDVSLHMTWAPLVDIASNLCTTNAT